MKKFVYPAFVLLGIVWGSNFIFMKWATETISPLQTVLLRVLFGFVPVLILALSRCALKWSHARYAHHFLVMSLLATTFYYLAFAKGAALLPSGIAGMLSGAIPLFSFMTACLFLQQEQINRLSVAGLIIGFVGVLLIARPWSSNGDGIDINGVVYMIGGSLSLGCSFVYAKRFLVNKDLSPLALSTYQIGLALLVLVFTTDLQGIERISNNPRALAGLVFGLGILGTGVAYILYYFLVQHLGAIRASGVTYIPPVVAMGISALLVHEPLHINDLLALVCIIAGVYILQLGKSTQSRPSTSPSS
ncbi:DMT family transporter [Pseudomonas vanderleydeniana]|uniref:DMT family transporter n=1 Tax=Pseudomonas vanderleydeniana TaxID=2745495 RepID=A0A9E6PGY9_9PSED|nr:DMT family transporter [Pseudomonas vanderleydeniana]QXI26298.1 DMT family transporter [Pseudomonas vanderleydeniana]